MIRSALTLVRFSCPDALEDSSASISSFICCSAISSFICWSCCASADFSDTLAAWGVLFACWVRLVLTALLPFSVLQALLSGTANWTCIIMRVWSPSWSVSLTRMCDTRCTEVRTCTICNADAQSSLGYRESASRACCKPSLHHRHLHPGSIDCSHTRAECGTTTEEPCSPMTQPTHHHIRHTIIATLCQRRRMLSLHSLTGSATACKTLRHINSLHMASHTLSIYARAAGATWIRRRIADLSNI